MLTVNIARGEISYLIIPRRSGIGLETGLGDAVTEVITDSPCNIQSARAEPSLVMMAVISNQLVASLRKCRSHHSGQCRPSSPSVAS